MIVVRIELHSAISGRITEIGRMLIGNVGGDSDRGDYEVKVLRREERHVVHSYPAFEEWVSKPVTRTGEVKNYPRLSYNVWRLVSRALRSAFPEEK